MKELILDNKKKIKYNFPECNLSDNKYYGVSMTLETKGFIIKESYNSTLYKVLCGKEVTKFNNLILNNKKVFASLQNIINELLSNDCMVYEFDTPQELFAWLAKE